MTNYRETTAALLALAGVGGILVSAAAVAQEVEIEEVLVTARKKAEDLQETPLAISAFTAKQIEEQGISSIDDVALRTPGFSFLSAAGRQDFFRPVIRGQSNILGDANASFFIDGVFVNGAISTLTLDSVERVEVIKGPQSALFGRATFAGAINYVTKRPGDELAGKLSLTAGEDGG